MSAPDTTETGPSTRKKADATAEALTSVTEGSSSSVSPLDAAAYRLERLLVGSSDGVGAAKSVRRWLGTSSGTAGKADLLEVQAAAVRLLDPKGVSSRGLQLLKELKDDAGTMDVDDNNNDGEDDAMPMEEEKVVVPEEDAAETKYLTVASREVESWLLSLAVRILYRASAYDEALALATEAVVVATDHVSLGANHTFTSKSNHGSSSSTYTSTSTSSLYPFLARLQRWKATVQEQISGKIGYRQELVLAHSHACNRRDVDSQATLLNLILRDLLRDHQVEQAQKFLSHSSFPETASHNQLCRYLYHSGLIHALRLNYTSAYSSLSQSLRKAPSNTGLGFRIAVQRTLVVVKLLMGEIPERTIFFDKEMRTELEPYLYITQAVRRGDLAVFGDTVATHAARLRKDGTFTLVRRLGHSVVKAGLRRLVKSYSRISLQEIAKKLSLKSASSAEYVVAKAVRDGVIDATIHHDTSEVRSQEVVDLYGTVEPAEAFHRRIAYCLTTYNDAVRAMRYPPDQYRLDLEKSRGESDRKNDRETDPTDEEMAKELEDELDEDY